MSLLVEHHGRRSRMKADPSVPLVRASPRTPLLPGSSCLACRRSLFPRSAPRQASPCVFSAAHPAPFLERGPTPAPQVERVVLKYRGQPIDLGVPFGLTGVPSNATVQLSLGSSATADLLRQIARTFPHSARWLPSWRRAGAGPPPNPSARSAPGASRPAAGLSPGQAPSLNISRMLSPLGSGLGPQGEFSDGETIGDVVAAFQAQGQLPASIRNVSAVYTRTKVEGEDLARRSLRALGIKKSAMLRLQFEEGAPDAADQATTAAGSAPAPAPTPLSAPAPVPVPEPAWTAPAPVPAPPQATAAPAATTAPAPVAPQPPAAAAAVAASSAEPQSAPPPPPPPHKSLDTCGRALAALRASAFDADAGPIVRLLVRVLDNVISRPADPRTRSIKLSSKALARHASTPGVKEFLWVRHAAWRRLSLLPLPLGRR